MNKEKGFNKEKAEHSFVKARHSYVKAEHSFVKDEQRLNKAHKNG